MEKQSKSEKNSFPLNPVASSGATGPPRGHQAFTKVYSENPWKNKGEPRLLGVPLCYVSDAIRGVRKSVTFNQKREKSLEIQENVAKQLPTKSGGVERAPARALRAPFLCKGARRKSVGKQREIKVLRGSSIS